MTVKHFAIKTLVNGAALWVAALVVSGIHLGEDKPALATRLMSILLVAVVFGLVNAVIKPIIKLLSMPAIIVTLGLFTWIVNALMLQLTSWLAGSLGLDFRVEHFFWDAVLGALVVAFVSLLLDILLPDADEL